MEVFCIYIAYFIFHGVGIRDRHWERMSAVVQADIKPQPDTSLMHMVEIGLSNPQLLEK